ncbi:FHA domain-containing protein [Amedibacillus sp. YH-ame6]
MDERLKKIELREDGFLEVTLKKGKDFDDYIYQQMQKDSGCLPCVRDPRMKSKLYYDTKGYVSLQTYLKAHMFDEVESIEFLIYLLEDMVRVNTAKPILMDPAYIFLSYDGGVLRFLVIPADVDQWVFQKKECREFLEELIFEMRISQGYEAIGYLTYMKRYEEVSLPMILQGLHDLREQHRPKPTLLEKLLHLHKEQEYMIKDIPLPKAYPQLQVLNSVMEEQGPYLKEEEESQSIHAHTVVLLQESSLSLYDETTKEEVLIHKDTFTIGRAKDNDLCIPEQFISQHHACIYRNTREIEDLSSSNGTFINQQRIKRETLQDKDRISFAKFSFIVKIKDG